MKMRKDAKLHAKPGQRTFTVNIDYPDGRSVEDKGVYNLEADLWIDGQQYAITTRHVEGQPNQYVLVDGVTIRFTEENVNKS
jgi:hypothetical protein